jgi:hypothetical protein
MAELISLTPPCPKCQATLPASLFNTDKLVACPTCNTELCVFLFPACFGTPEKGALAESVLDGEQASCFYHPQKKASIVCDGCGRFLCALCDISLADKGHFCPSCLQTGAKKGNLANLHNRRIPHDKVALAIAVFPLLFCYVTIITAPIAIYISLRYWKAPLSIVTRSRARFVAAIILSIIQICVWIIVIAAISRGCK